METRIPVDEKRKKQQTIQRFVINKTKIKQENNDVAKERVNQMESSIITQETEEKSDSRRIIRRKSELKDQPKNETIKKTKSKRGRKTGSKNTKKKSKGLEREEEKEEESITDEGDDDDDDDNYEDEEEEDKLIEPSRKKRKLNQKKSSRTKKKTIKKKKPIMKLKKEMASSEMNQPGPGSPVFISIDDFFKDYEQLQVEVEAKKETEVPVQEPERKEAEEQKKPRKKTRVHQKKTKKRLMDEEEDDDDDDFELEEEEKNEEKKKEEKEKKNPKGLRTISKGNTGIRLKKLVEKFNRIQKKNMLLKSMEEQRISLIQPLIHDLGLYKNEILNPIDSATELRELSEKIVNLVSHMRRELESEQMVCHSLNTVNNLPNLPQKRMIKKTYDQRLKLTDFRLNYLAKNMEEVIVAVGLLQQKFDETFKQLRRTNNGIFQKVLHQRRFHPDIGAITSLLA